MEEIKQKYTETDSLRQLKQFFSKIRDLLRDDESISGDRALDVITDFLFLKLLLNCIIPNTEESEIDDTEEALTVDTEEREIDDTEKDDNEESETDNSEKDDNEESEEESEEESDEELTDYTKSNIIKLKINNKKVDIDLNYKSILRYIYDNEIKNGFRIIKNTLFKDIKTIKKEDKGYYYLEKIGISVRFKNANDGINEIINQCEINNIKLYMKIELFDGEIKKIKI